MSISTASLNRAAIVTGAAQGIGRAIALRLARDGYDVAVNDLPSTTGGNEALNAVADEIRAQGRKAIAVTGDVSNEQDVQQMVDRTVKELGMLRVMVANAGIGLPLSTVVDTPLDVWNRFLTVNLTGNFLCYRAAARQMLKQGHGGRIIGASSTFGKRGVAKSSAYCASKFGIRGLTQSLASELAKEGITVNAYAPGVIDTPLLQEGDRSFTASTGNPPGTLLNLVTARAPMNRIGKPEDIAGLVSYIASDEADFMTGQSVLVDGGMYFD